MKWRNSQSLLLVYLLIQVSCKQVPNKQFNEESNNKLQLEYATGFEISYNDNYKTLKIFGIGEDKDNYETFKLIPKAGTTNLKDPGVVPVPCKRIICLSSTQLTYFFALNDMDNIVAINSSRHLINKEMNDRIDMGLVKKIGKEGHFNTELIASLDPDVIFISPFKRGGYDMLKNLGYPLVPMAAYEEGSPLGRAEWVKMIAAFINQEKQADSLFNGIVSRYNKLKKLTSQVEKRPTIFSGKLRSGTWYVPGGDSFYAQYFKDAGADYIIKDNKKGAYPLDFESLYAKAASADFWRLLLTEPVGYDRNAFISEDSRYVDFKACQTGNIIVCNIRKKPYYEQNAMKPDVILADYIYFLHPELLPDHQPEFYEFLK